MSHLTGHINTKLCSSSKHQYVILILHSFYSIIILNLNDCNNRNSTISEIYFFLRSVFLSFGWWADCQIAMNIWLIYHLFCSFVFTYWNPYQPVKRKSSCVRNGTSIDCILYYYTWIYFRAANNTKKSVILKYKTTNITCRNDRIIIIAMIWE